MLGSDLEVDGGHRLQIIGVLELRRNISKYDAIPYALQVQVPVAEVGMEVISSGMYEGVLNYRGRLDTGLWLLNTNG